MKEVLLHSGLKSRKPARKVPKKTGVISRNIFISQSGKMINWDLPKVSAGIAYRDGEWSVEKWYRGKDDFYDIYKGDEGVAFNRDSLKEAKRDIAKFKKYKGNIKEFFESFSPDIEDVLKSKSDIRGKDLDKQIVPLIKELNDSGYKTAWSCAGHADEDDTTGFVTFSKSQSNDDCNGIIKILKRHGIENIKYGDDNLKRTVFRFKRVDKW